MSETSATPRHIGFILDGNRRWAREQGIPTLEGHRSGYERLKDIAEEAFDQGVEFVSAYIFSTENWNRSKDEVDYLMDLLPIVFRKYIKEFKKKNIRIRWLGTYDRLGEKQKSIITRAVEETKNNTKGSLCLCFNYGGQQEIIDAAKRLIKEGVSADEVTKERFEKELYEPEVPPVDIMVRTSGEQRISNFMLWRIAYSELFFIDKHWPAFEKADVGEIITEFKRRCRRFGS